MGELRTTFEQAELLATHDVEEPLIAAGVRCHGGFTSEGNYVSPRTKHRADAIEAWQQRHLADVGGELLDLPLATWPEHYPNVEQAKFLIREGVRQPIVTSLTRVGTVEGFGAMIRHSAVPDIQRHFADSIDGTATLHLDRGLLEAHARDEAGFGEEAGHKQMWYAARDVAFEHPLSAEQEAAIVERTALRPSGPPPAGAPAAPDAGALADIDQALIDLVQRMIRILLIEISAFHTFAWAEAVLSDEGLVAGEGEAARIVSYIRQDESPHVGYLRTSLTEMRDRTFVGASGRKYEGSGIVGPLWDRAVAASLANSGNHDLILRELDLALDGNPRAASILEGFHRLAS
jgi:hypothetical protein